MALVIKSVDMYVVKDLIHTEVQVTQDRLLPLERAGFLWDTGSLWGGEGTQEKGLETSSGFISNSIKKELTPPLLSCHCCTLLSFVFLPCRSGQMLCELWEGIHQMGMSSQK